MRIDTWCDHDKKRIEERKNLKREFLKELDISEENIEKIMAEYGKATEKMKNQLAALTTEKNNLNSQLEEANKQIESFADIDVEKIKQETEDWKNKFSQAQKEAEKQLSELKFDHALESKLSGYKTKDVGILKGLLKKDELKLTDDGNILGLDDQISKIKNEKAFLFESEDGKPNIVKGGTGGNGGNGKDEINAARSAMGLPPIKE